MSHTYTCAIFSMIPRRSGPGKTQYKGRSTADLVRLWGCLILVESLLLDLRLPHFELYLHVGLCPYFCLASHGNGRSDSEVPWPWTPWPMKRSSPPAISFLCDSSRTCEVRDANASFLTFYLEVATQSHPVMVRVLLDRISGVRPLEEDWR